MSSTQRRIGLAAFYDSINKERGFTLAPHHYPIVAAIEDDRIENLLILGPPGMGKALAPDTSLLTPAGWVQLRYVYPGTRVMHPSGDFVTVLARQDTAPAQLWRVSFSDGRSLVAHDNHLWRIHHKDIGQRRTSSYATDEASGLRVRTRGRVRTIAVKDAWIQLSTRELRSLMERQPTLRCFVPLTDQIELPEIPVWCGDTPSGKGIRRKSLPGFEPHQQLAMPPYTLGCILGDGYITDGGVSTVTSLDQELADLMQAEVQPAGMTVTCINSRSDRCPVWRIDGAAARMHELGLAGKRAHEKSIPPIYLHTSLAQRLALLQGLMDTDGHVDSQNGFVQFTSVSQKLAQGVQHLVWSLGGVSNITVLSKWFSHKGQKKLGRPAYRVSLRLRDPRIAFRLSRKRNRAYPPQYAETLKLRVTSIEPAIVQSSVCIQVNHLDGLFLAGDYVVTHNSQLLSTTLPVWELGHDPSLTVMSVSAGEALPQNFMSAAMQIIQHDKTFKDLFPEVRPNPAMGWSIQRGLFVTGHAPGDPDPSFACYGVSSKRITGAHARFHIYDDLHDRENASTSESRADVRKVYFDTLLGRADPRGVRRIAVGRWWAKDDVYQEWIKSGDWVVMQLPASRPRSLQLWYDVFVPRFMVEQSDSQGCVFSETLKPEPEHLQDPTSPYIRYRAPYGTVDPQRQGFYWPGSPSKRREYITVSRRQPRVAAINYDGDMSAGVDDIFNESDFIPYAPPCDLSLGRGAPGFEPWMKQLGGGKSRLKQAWDTALGQPRSESATVALTALLVPCQSWHCGEDPALVGPCDFHYDVILLRALIRDVDFRGLAMMLRTEYALWHPDEVIVEEKQSGVSLIQTFRGSEVPIRGQKVEQGKVDRAINPVTKDSKGSSIGGGAASVQGWARMRRISYPDKAPWVTHGPDGDPAAGFFKKVCAFSGGVRGSDEFDALVHMVTKAIMLSHSRGLIGAAPVEDTAMDTMGALSSLQDPRRTVLEAFGLLAGGPNSTNVSLALDPGAQFNPWEAASMCGAPCNHFGIHDNHEHCGLHDRPTSAISGCAYWTPKKQKVFLT